MKLGLIEGTLDGTWLGDSVGREEGISEGSLVGCIVGLFEVKSLTTGIIIALAFDNSVTLFVDAYC